MELVKEVNGSKIYKKRSGRFGVKDAAGKWVNADEKVKILLGEGLIKAVVPAPKAEPVAEEAASEEAPAEEAAAEETPAE